MIEVNNLTRSKVSEAFLKKAAEEVLRGEKKQGKEVSIALVGAKKAKTLNRRNRKKDTVPNVLSFEGMGSQLGEVVLCPQRIRQDAREYGMIFERALAWMLVHGLLHLSGYAHETPQDEKRMEQKERLYLSRILMQGK